MRRRVITRVAGTGLLLAVATAGPMGAPAYADVENGNLPGGTGLSVAIDSPGDGMVTVPGDLTVAGTASVGQAAPVKNTSLVYVLDLSDSTGASAGGSGCGNPNGDATTNSILDCEIAAATALNDVASGSGTVDQVGAAVFGVGGATADVQPVFGWQLTTTPDADLNADGVADIDEVMGSARLANLFLFTRRVVEGYRTNFLAAVQNANQVAAAMTSPNKIVLLMSDGDSTGSGSALPAVAARPAGTTYYTFAVGSRASCTRAGSQGSLAQIAEATGGSCTQVTDPSSLPAIVPGVVDATLDAVDVSVDGAPWSPVTTSPALPLTGPGSVSYSGAVSGLGVGVHDVCVRATGTDLAGSASVTDCHEVVVYDASAGFVTGGGWVASPAGAYGPDGSLAGKASFGLVSKYHKGATTPSGRTQLSLPAAGMTFHSSGYDWLLVAEGSSQVSGTGVVSGLGAAYDGEWAFRLWAVDGGVSSGPGQDSLRIKIFRDTASGEVVLYDSAGADLGGGSVVVHAR